MFSSTILAQAQKVISNYDQAAKKIVTAESCTAGLLASALTTVPGASRVLERGFIAYSNDSKIEVLGVLPELLAEHGAVSPEVVEAMAEGALAFSLADIALAITGIAGPDGGTLNKPVGLVYFGYATRDGATFHTRSEFKGNREQIRLSSVLEALNMLASFTGKSVDDL